MTTRAVPLRLRYREVPRLPRLAWVATIDRAAGDVLVFHGSAVECREEWMVEGVWDAEFRSGGFHESPHFFGSGLRLADGCLYCVPASALVNRLMYRVHRDRVLVDNSLALLLAFTGETLEPGHDYRTQTYALPRDLPHQPALQLPHPVVAQSRGRQRRRQAHRRPAGAPHRILGWARLAHDRGRVVFPRPGVRASPAGPPLHGPPHRAQRRRRRGVHRLPG